MRLLAQRGIPVQPWQGGTSACPIDTPVRAARGRIAGFTPPLETDCATLVAWSDFEGEVDRAARATMGSPVVSVRHYGSFACRRFSVVLTPNSDRFHQDHIHVDIGPWRKCAV